MATTTHLTIGDYVKHPRFEGIALWFVAHPLLDCECAQYGEYCECEPERDPDTAIVRMVGDDQDHRVSTDELVRADSTEFCRDCGQIGCQSNVYE